MAPARSAQRIFRVREVEIVAAGIGQLLQDCSSQRTKGVKVEVGDEGDVAAIIDVPGADAREATVSVERQHVEVGDTVSEKARQVSDGCRIDQDRLAVRSVEFDLPSVPNGLRMPDREDPGELAMLREETSKGFGGAMVGEHNQPEKRDQQLRVRVRRAVRGGIPLYMIEIAQDARGKRLSRGPRGYPMIVSPP